MKNILIGNAWPYANYQLHIGHLSALLPGDVLAKYHRAKGNNVIFVSGTDSHGTPITERAKIEKKTPEEIAKFYHEEDVKSFEKIGFEYDKYTSTMSETHKAGVKKFFKLFMDNGYLYEKTIEQDYCETCNEYKSDREIEGLCPVCGEKAKGDQCDACNATFDSNDLLEKKCRDCGSTPVTRENTHLYFKLSAFQARLEDYVKNHEEDWRKNALGETRKFLQMGLIDRAATRQLSWGVEVPFDGFEDKRIYVWLEAVLGYLTTAEQVCKDRNTTLAEFLKNDDNTISYYCHGKDNIPFHTVIYPALIMASGLDLQLPKVIVSGEYFNLNNEKMSKSKGNLLTINDLVDTYGVDTSRYYISANGPEKRDVNFTHSDIVQAHNKFLVGVLGNFINRNFSFIKKKFDGVITEGTIDSEVIKLTHDTYAKVGDLIEKAELKAAVEAIFDYIGYGNKYYDDKTPWIKVKENIDEFNDITYTCTYMIANIANLIAPIMIEASSKIRRMLNLDEFKWEEITLSGNIKLEEIELLYNRIDNE